MQTGLRYFVISNVTRGTSCSALTVAVIGVILAKRLRREPPLPRGRYPKGLTARDRMEHKLLTTRGRRLYKQRDQTVEPVFGQIKSARGCDGFMHRGMAACASEWKLLCATHNLLQLWRNEKVSGPGRRRGRDGQRFGWGRGKKTGGCPARTPRSLMGSVQQEKIRLGAP